MTLHFRIVIETHLYFIMCVDRDKNSACDKLQPVVQKACKVLCVRLSDAVCLGVINRYIFRKVQDVEYKCDNDTETKHELWCFIAD